SAALRTRPEAERAAIAGEHQLVGGLDVARHPTERDAELIAEARERAGGERARERSERQGGTRDLVRTGAPVTVGASREAAVGAEPDRVQAGIRHPYGWARRRREALELPLDVCPKRERFGPRAAVAATACAGGKDQQDEQSASPHVGMSLHH